MVHESLLNGSIGPIRPAHAKAAQSAAPGVPAFAEVLKKTEAVSRPTQERSQGLKFSAHAQQRMEQRNIRLSEGELERLEQAADRAADKGARESLFLLDKLGLIVNVPNRTVLTAVDPERLRDGIVTNIDSTVLIGGSQG